MSYQEIRSVASFISTILITTLYSLYMFQHYPEGSAYSKEVFTFWGAFILILIPVSIVARIIIWIVISIVSTIATQETDPSFADERDKLIELKALRNALYVLSIGFVLSMAALVLGQTPAVMFIILIGAGLLSDVVSDVSQFYFYRRGA